MADGPAVYSAPTLLIGIGDFGAGVVRRVRLRTLEAGAGQEGRPRYCAINSHGLPTPLAWETLNPDLGATDLRPADRLHLWVSGHDLAREIEAGRKVHLGGAPLDDLRLVGVESGAGSRPPVGRVLMVESRSAIERFVRQHLVTLRDSWWAHAAIEGGAMTGGGAISIYIVVTATGATGNSLTIPVAAILRQVAAELGERVIVTLVVHLPGLSISVDPDRPAANGYGFTWELDLAMSGTAPVWFPNEKTGIEQAGSPLFDAILAVEANTGPEPGGDTVRLDSLERAQTVVAEALRLLTTTPMGPVVEQRRSDMHGVQQVPGAWGKVPFLLGLGLSEIVLPGAEIDYYVAHRIVAGVLEARVAVPADEAADAMAEAVLQHTGLHVLGGDDLLARLAGETDAAGNPTGRTLQAAIDEVFNPAVLERVPPEARDAHIDRLLVAAADAARVSSGTTGPRITVEAQAAVDEELARIAAQSGLGGARAVAGRLATAVSVCAQELATRLREEWEPHVQQHDNELGGLRAWLARARTVGPLRFIYRRRLLRALPVRLLGLARERAAADEVVQRAVECRRILHVLRDHIDGWGARLDRGLMHADGLLAAARTEMARVSEMTFEERRVHGLLLLRPGDQADLDWHLGDALFPKVENDVVQVCLRALVSADPLFPTTLDSPEPILERARGFIRPRRVMEVFARRYADRRDTAVAHLNQLADDGEPLLPINHQRAGTSPILRFIAGSGEDLADLRRWLPEVRLDRALHVDIGARDRVCDRVCVFSLRIAVPPHALRSIASWKEAFERVSTGQGEERVLVDPALRLLPEPIPVETDEGPGAELLPRAVCCGVVTGTLVLNDGTASYVGGERPVPLGQTVAQIREGLLNRQDIVIGMIARFITLGLSGHGARLRQELAVLEIADEPLRSLVDAGEVRKLTAALDEFERRCPRPRARAAR